MMPHISTLTLRRNQHPVFLAKHFTDRLGPCGYVEANSSLKRSSTGATVSWISGWSSLVFFFLGNPYYTTSTRSFSGSDLIGSVPLVSFFMHCYSLSLQKRNVYLGFLMLFWGQDGRSSTAKTLSGNRYPCLANMRVGKQGFTRF
jgi:hypothetical protein